MRAAGKIHHPAPIVGVYLGAVPDRRCRSVHLSRPTAKYVTLKLTLHRVIYIPQEFGNDPCLQLLSEEREAKHADADANSG